MKTYTKFQKIFFTLLPFVILLLIFFVCYVGKDYTYLLRPCLSYELFDIHCAGCGLTRSVTALVNGEILLSLRQNIFPILLLVISALLYSEFLLKVYGKKIPFTLFKEKYLWGLLIFALIYTVSRNIFPILAPI